MESESLRNIEKQQELEGKLAEMKQEAQRGQETLESLSYEKNSLEDKLNYWKLQYEQLKGQNENVAKELDTVKI